MDNQLTSAPEILKRLLKGHELTTGFTGENKRLEAAWINKWKDEPVMIPYAIAQWLILNKLVAEDSGNFETGEIHYLLVFRVQMSFVER